MNTHIPHKFAFSKAEKLCGKKAFDALFKHPFQFKKGVLKFFYLSPFSADLVKAPISFAFAVPKKFFKHANQRNLLKRRMREAVRLNKHILKELLVKKEDNLVVFLKYESFQIADFQEIDNLVKKSFHKIIHHLNTPQ